MPKNSESIKSKKEGKCGFVDGYFTGKAEVYCEQISAGAKLAALLVCRRESLQRVLRLIGQEELRFVISGWTKTQVNVWIFKYGFVRKLIAATGRNKTPTAASVWATGKLFGYSDAEIGTYLYRHGLVKSTFRLESNPPEYSGNPPSRKGA